MQKSEYKVYFDVLEESLKKKVEILEQISEQNKIQTELAKNDKFDYDIFGVTIEKKEQLIQEVNQLDGGFQSVYERMKEVIQKDKDSYREEIGRLKTLISQVMDKSVNVMAEERRNKDEIERRKDSLKKEVTMARTTNKVASNYYKTMSKLNVMDSQFVDYKK